MDLNAGTIFDERLRLEEPIYRGPAGSVWLARDTASGDEVAVKLMSPEQLVDDPVALQRFEREGSAAERIHSAHVVRVLRHGISREGIPYIVMERVRGESLAACLERAGRLDAERVVAIVTMLGQALADVHAHGVVHRDLNPSNVMLDEQAGVEHAKLVDFGVAKVTKEASTADRPVREDLTLPGKLIGSPVYLSPEQVSAKPVSGKLDLWSLAVIAYQALTGKLPFTGDAPAKIFLAILHTQHEPPSALVPELGVEVDAFFRKAFHRDPEQRFASGPELAQALRAAVAPLVEARARARAAAAEVPAASAAGGRRMRGAARDAGAGSLSRAGSVLLAMAVGAALGLLGVVLYRGSVPTEVAPPTGGASATATAASASGASR